MTSVIYNSSRPGAAFGRIGFGGAAIGISDYMGHYDAAAEVNREASRLALIACNQLGISYIDTAPGYGSGLSETIIGETLSRLPNPYFLATKVPLNARHEVRRSFEESLRRLRVDRLDLLQIHGGSIKDEDVADILTPGGMLAQMQALRDEGLIKEIGFTSEDNNVAVYRLIETDAFDSMQIAYNLILQHPYEPTRPFGSLYAAKDKDMRVVTMRTATSGIFQRWVQMVNPGNSFDYNEALVQFVLSNKLVDIALVGIRTVEVAQSCARLMHDESGRIDVDALWNRFV
jgi:aryl-alcohol dehydrogenase-like predicted oxidoreductase